MHTSLTRFHLNIEVLLIQPLICTILSFSNCEGVLEKKYEYKIDKWALHESC